MRLRDILAEAANKYQPMFSAFRDEHGILPPAIQNRIVSIEKLMKRPDRIVWALRWERYEAALRMPQPVRDKMLRKFGSEVDTGQRQLYEQLIRDFFPHWLSLDSTQIEGVVFDRQTPNDLMEQMFKAENEWKESRKQIINHGDYNDYDDEEDDRDYDDEYDDDGKQRMRDLKRKGQIYKLIDFGDGWAWWNLNRTYCTVEAGAMGHCGNKPSAKVGDEVLSLRQNKGGDNFRPVLTFILHADGYLGEMKGRANAKPAARYHKMIIKLLLNDIVKGCDGGGYEASKNFSLLDLPEPVRAKLIAIKPSLLSMDDRLMMIRSDYEKGTVSGETETNRQYVIDNITKRLKAKRFYGVKVEIGPNDADLIIEEWASREKYIETEGRWNCMENLGKIFHNLTENIYHFSDVSDRRECEDIADKARLEYFDDVFDNLLPYSHNEYKLSGVFDHVQKNGRVTVQMSIRDYLIPSPADVDTYYADADEDNIPAPILDNIAELNETNNNDRWDSWSDIEDIFEGDEIYKAIAKAAFDGEDELDRATIIAIAKQFSKNGSTHYYSRDPNQMSLDL